MDNNSKLAKFILFIPFVVPIALFIGKFMYDNDFWFTINQGRYILENGFPDTVINTIHEGLPFVYQSWGSGILFYLIYHYIGNYGIILLTLIVLELTTYFYYKLCVLVSKNNHRSIILTTLLMLIFLLYTFPRPHLFTVLNLVLILYCLEKYIKTNNKKKLIPIPFIYLLQVNMHGMYYIPLLIFIIPYLINSFKFKIKFLNQGPVNYHKKPLFITYLISLLVGFINPYTYKIYTYGFSSYGNQVMKENINELKSLALDNSFGILCIATMILTYVVFLISRKKKIPIRYYLLLIGTTILALDAYKSFYFFIICSFFPIAYIYRCNKEQKYSKKVKIVTISIILILATIFTSTTRIIEPLQHKPASFLVQNKKIDNPRVYTSFDDGSYFEYMGFNCYVDPRAELFVKKINKKADILIEYFDLQKGLINIQDFLDRYNFDYLVIRHSDILYTYISDEDDIPYTKIYEDDNYQIWEKK